MLFWNDGEFVDEREATVPVFDWGYLYGDGCFESIALIEGVLLDLDARLERLQKSAKAMRIEPDLSWERVRELVLETGARNNFAQARTGYLRPMLSRAASSIGIFSAKRTGTLRILGKQNPPYQYGEAVPTVRTILSTYTRTTAMSLDPRIKSFSYSTGILARFEAEDRGADWAVFRDANGVITEAFSANVFCVSRGKIFTPRDTNVLSGITRRGVIAAARSAGYECVETDLTRYDLETADEFFLTSAGGNVQAVSDFEGIPFIAPGPVTTAVRTAYIASAIASGTPVPVSATR